MSAKASDRQALVALSLAIQIFALSEPEERILELWKHLDSVEAERLLNKYTGLACEASFGVMPEFNRKGQLN